MNPKLIILLEGGCVRDVIATGAADVAFIDFDTDGVRSVRLPEIDNGQTPVYLHRPWTGEGPAYGQLTVDPEQARALYAAVAQDWLAEQQREAELLELERNLS